MNAEPLLRHFAFTDGLNKGTRTANYVISTAALALIPGFGSHGYLVTASIQDTVTAVVETPFGWLADRFGWAKAVLVSYGLKFLDTVLFVAAVVAAYYGAEKWIWIFISLEAVVDAFVISLQDGAYEAAYSEWYRVHITRGGGDFYEAPPLFVRSLRYAMRVRLVLPLVLVALVMLLQHFPLIGNFDTFKATFVSFAFILFLRLWLFARMFRDLYPIIAEEEERIARQRGKKGSEILKEAWKPIRSHLGIFILYGLTSFQISLYASCLNAVSIREMDKLGFPAPYGWLSGVALVMLVYVLDSFFWMFVGYKIDKTNATKSILSIGWFLLATCALSFFVYQRQAAPLIQAFSFSLCVFASSVCANAVRRLLASYIREWLKSDLIATWLSLAESAGLFAIGIFLALIVVVKDFIPTTPLLLVTSAMLALAFMSRAKHIVPFSTT